MHILFVGELCLTGGGPSNVNEGYINNLTSNFTYVKCKNKLLKYIEAFFKILFVKVVVISGLNKLGLCCILFARFLHKKTIYIMHGCAEYEVEINNTHNNSTALAIKQEADYLEKVDKVLVVSKKYSLWLKKRYPQYKFKIDFLFNGVTKPNIKINDYTKIKGSVIAVGGDRIIKNNKVVCNVVEHFNGSVNLKVFGSIYGDSCPVGWKYSKYIGWVPQEQLYHEMASSELFVLNSILESFGLSVIDALNCKCSILVSQYVGVTDLLKLEDSDIIYNPNDEEEIRTKIQYLLNHPNYERIIKSVDYNKLSYKVRVNELENKCKELIQ